MVEQLQGLPQRFVLFCDDLSFEAGEGDYRVLKSVLDGSLEQAPENVLLYATSNRRHLVPEKQSDNDAASDTSSDSEIDEELGFISPLDTVDPYSVFQQALTSAFRILHL